jgi:23S rRNA (adenine2030-N6)-methyltransferase
MNYRHAFHAGNFADVVKHAVLVRVLEYLRRKEAPFRVIDTHAGAGLYDLSGDEATRSGEWREGIGKVIGAHFEPPIAALIEPYLARIRALNPAGPLRIYPGSPLLARALLRPQDRLIACELEPNAAKALAHHLRGDERAKAIAIDGLVLIDPPFEYAHEFPRLAATLAAAYRKWPTGIFLVWYPVKDAAQSTAFLRKLSASAMAKTLRAELSLTPAGTTTKLRGSGLVIVNPPWTLPAELEKLLPALAKILVTGGQPTVAIEWVAGEKG